MKKNNFLSVFGFLSILFGIGFLFGCKPKNNVKADIYINSSNKQVYCYKLNDNFESDNYNNSFVIYPYDDNFQNFTYVYCLTNPYKNVVDLDNGYVYEYSFLNRFYYCSNINNKYTGFNVDWDYQNNRYGVYFDGNTPYYNFKNIFIFSTLTLNELYSYNNGSLDYDYEINNFNSFLNCFDLVNNNTISSSLKYYQVNGNFDFLITNSKDIAYKQGYDIGYQQGLNDVNQPFTFMSVVNNFLNYEFIPGLKFSYLVAIGLGFSILIILIKSVLR